MTNTVNFLLKSLNENSIPEYFREIKLILQSKTKSSEATLDETRPIAVASHLAKIFEKIYQDQAWIIA